MNRVFIELLFHFYCIYSAKCVSKHANYVLSPLFSPSALAILLCILGFMPPAISPTSLSCAYRKQCRMRMTSTCTSCSTRSLQACRFTPRLAQMAAAVSLLHHPFQLYILISATFPICREMYRSIGSVQFCSKCSKLSFWRKQTADVRCRIEIIVKWWYWPLFVSVCTCRLKMEDEAWVESVSVSGRCSCGPWWRTHCGLPPDPQRGESNREGNTGGQVSWIKPATTIIQACWVQRSAPLCGRKTRIIYDSRKSTSRWTRNQSHTGC